MQILILGMHRSGTSMLARLVNLMGVYFGNEEDAISTNQQNPQGFWERQDVRDLNDYLLHSNDSDWDKLSGFAEEEIDDAVYSHFKREALKVIDNLEPNSPWIMKEPRFCILLLTWKKLLKTPIFIHIYRNPIEVASSLYTRNGISIPEGLGLWERYNVDALNKSIDSPRILVSHSKLMKNPVTEVKVVYEKLINQGVLGLKMPSDEKIKSFVDFDLYRERLVDVDVFGYLNQQQMKLFEDFESSSVYSDLTVRSISTGAKLILENYDHKTKLLTSSDLTKKKALELVINYSDELAMILESKRWKIGDSLVSLVNCIIGKRRKNSKIPLRVDKIHKKLINLLSLECSLDKSINKKPRH